MKAMTDTDLIAALRERGMNSAADELEAMMGPREWVMCERGLFTLSWGGGEYLEREVTGAVWENGFDPSEIYKAMDNPGVKIPIIPRGWIPIERSDEFGVKDGHFHPVLLAGTTFWTRAAFRGSRWINPYRREVRPTHFYLLPPVPGVEG